MHHINAADLRLFITEAQTISHAMSLALRELATRAPADLQHHLVTLAAASENVSDKASAAHSLTET